VAAARKDWTWDSDWNYGSKDRAERSGEEELEMNGNMLPGNEHK